MNKNKKDEVLEGLKGIARTRGEDEDDTISELKEYYDIDITEEEVTSLRGGDLWMYVIKPFKRFNNNNNIVNYFEGLKEIANSNITFVRTLLKEAIVESFGIKYFFLHDYLLDNGFLDYLSKEETSLLLNNFEDLLVNPKIPSFERNILERISNKLKNKNKQFESDEGI